MDAQSMDFPPVCERYQQMLDELDADGITEHLVEHCMECSRLALEYFAADKELLFPDILPSWVQKEKEEQEKIAAEEEQTAAEEGRIAAIAAKVTAKQKTGPMNAEEIKEYLQKLNITPGFSDASLLWEIRKLRRNTEEEARAELIKLRQTKSEKKKAEAGSDIGPPVKKKKSGQNSPQKTFNEKKIPWLPNKSQYYPKKERSVVNNVDQKRIISICVNFLFTGAHRFIGNKDELKAFDQILEEERVQLDEMIIANLKPLASPHFHVPVWVESYCKDRAKRRWIAVYGMRFYNENIESFPWNDEIPQEIATSSKDIAFEENLVYGQVDRLRIPSLEKRLTLTLNCLHDKYNPLHSNRLPIEEDTAALEFCLEKNISIAMDASTACHLMTRDFISRTVCPKYSVTVKTAIHKGTIRKVVFISKPKAAKAQYNTFFLKKISKYLFKSMYIERKRQERPSVPTHLKKIGVESTPELNDGSITIVNDVEMNNKELNAGNNPLDNIMDAINVTNPSSPSKNKSGKRYSVFRIGNQPVLIRSSPPVECHSEKLTILNNKHVTFDTALELLPCIGATRLNFEELLYNHCKRIFKNAEGHVIVRIGVEPQLQVTQKDANFEPPDKTERSDVVVFNVLQIHRLCNFNDPKSIEIEKDLNNMMTYRTHCLEELLNFLTKLEEGFFLLADQNNKLNISKENTQDDKNSIYLDKSQLIKTKRPYPSFNTVFCGIDHRIPLQWQIYTNRAPGAFIAPDCPIAHMMGLNRKRGKTRGNNSKKKVTFAKTEEIRIIEENLPQYEEEDSSSVTSYLSDQPAILQTGTLQIDLGDDEEFSGAEEII